MLRRCGRLFLNPSLRPGATSLLFHQEAGSHTTSDFSDSLLEPAAEALPPHLASSSAAQSGAAGLPPHLAHQQHQYSSVGAGSSSSSSTSSVARMLPVSAFTGAPFPQHATALLAAANRSNPYWVSGGTARKKQLPIKPGAQPVKVCLEGDGRPRMLALRFVDDINADDVELFLRDCLPIPENAVAAGTRLTLAANNNNEGRHHHHHHQNKSRARWNKYRDIGGGGSADSYAAFQSPQHYNPVVYALHKDRWRVPGNSDTVQQLCGLVASRRRGVPNQPESQEARFPPVFLDECYCKGMSLLRDQVHKVKDSTDTLFFNAEDFLCPPHTFVPLVPHQQQQQEQELMQQNAHFGQSGEEDEE